MIISSGAATDRLNVLLTGGRAPVTLELARLLHRAGHRVFVAESAAYHLCRVSAAVTQTFIMPPPRRNPQAYINELEILICRYQIDLLVPMCEEIFYIAQGLDHLGKHCRVLSSGLELLQRLHHKGDFINQAKQCGLTVPETQILASRAEWQEAVEQEARLNKGIVLKPAYSRFASRVIMPREPGRGKPGLERASACPPPEVTAVSPWLAQQYISGKALCTYSIVYDGTVVAHSAYGSLYRTGKVGASVYFEPLEHSPAFEWVRKFVSALGFTGQISFDFIEDNQGILYPIECNPRATSGIHLFTSEDRLEQALLCPEELARTARVITPQSGKKAMLTLPMLGCGITHIRSRTAWSAWRKALRDAEDVVYRKDDPRPSVEQLRVVYAAYRSARRNKLSITEILTEDIEWNGE